MIGWRLPEVSLTFPALALVNATFFHIGPTLVQRAFRRAPSPRSSFSARRHLVVLRSLPGRSPHHAGRSSLRFRRGSPDGLPDTVAATKRTLTELQKQRLTVLERSRRFELTRVRLQADMHFMLRVLKSVIGP